MRVKGVWESRVCESQGCVRVKGVWESRVCESQGCVRVKGVWESRVWESQGCESQGCVRVKGVWGSRVCESQGCMWVKGVWESRVTQFLICGKDNSKAAWPTRPQIGLRVAKALSCDTDESEFFPVNPPWVIVLKRGGPRKFGTSKCFSYPQTNLGARRSRRLWVIFATN